MNNRLFSRGRLVGMGAAAYAALATVKAPARAAQFEFKCATNLPLDNPSIARMTQMWAAVEQESGGRIHTQFFPNSVLGSDEAMFSQTRIGALHFNMLTPGIVASVVPSADIAFLAFAFRDPDEGARALEGPLGDYLRAETSTKGLFALKSVWSTGMFQVSSATHPIHGPDDLHGFKPRVSGSRIAVDFFKELGASPTPVSFAEVYTALQTKLVEGVTSPLITVEAARWYEILKYIAITNHAWGGEMVVANGETWKSLPPDLQAIIERNNTKFAALERTDAKALESTLTAKLRGQGITFNSIDQAPFRSRLQKYYQYWQGTFGPKVWGLLESAVNRKVG